MWTNFNVLGSGILHILKHFVLFIITFVFIKLIQQCVDNNIVWTVVTTLTVSHVVSRPDTGVLTHPWSQAGTARCEHRCSTPQCWSQSMIISIGSAANSNFSINFCFLFQLLASDKIIIMTIIVPRSASSHGTPLLESIILILIWLTHSLLGLITMMIFLMIWINLILCVASPVLRSVKSRWISQD